MTTDAPKRRGRPPKPKDAALAPKTEAPTKAPRVPKPMGRPKREEDELPPVDGDGIASVAATGDRRATLEAMRDRLALAMDLASVALLPQVSGQLAKIMAELDALPQAERSVSDELAARRQDRRTEAFGA